MITIKIFIKKIDFKIQNDNSYIPKCLKWDIYHANLDISLTFSPKALIILFIKIIQNLCIYA